MMPGLIRKAEEAAPLRASTKRHKASNINSIWILKVKILEISGIIEIQNMEEELI
jgi:hypothetical protein